MNRIIMRQNPCLCCHGNRVTVVSGLILQQYLYLCELHVFQCTCLGVDQRHIVSDVLAEIIHESGYLQQPDLDFSCSHSLSAVRAIDAVGCLVNSSVISLVISVHTLQTLSNTPALSNHVSHTDVLPQLQYFPTLCITMATILSSKLWCHCRGAIA